MPPAVSIIIATYNYGRYLGGAIESVLAQTFTDWEMVVDDDGSTDDTAEVIQPYLADKRIRYRRSAHRGQPTAKNAGIRLAQGPLIAFLDGDDAWLPEKLEKQVPLFDGDPKIGITYTGTCDINEDGALMGTRSCRRLRGYLFKESLYETIPAFSSSMVRRSVFDDVGLFNETIPLAIDYEFWMRAAMHWHFDYIDEPLVRYRSGHMNLSTRYKERRRLVINYILPHVLNDCGGRQLLTRRQCAEAWAKLFAGMAENDLAVSQLSSIRWNLRAAAAAPWMRIGWRGLMRACIPNRIAAKIKRLPGFCLENNPGSR
jgi:glycosyltransferase involved in cell wall biosynthesis